MAEYPYYKFQEGGGRQLLEGRYWNANGRGIAIVAAITNGVDWAAYIGADDGQNEEVCLLWAAENGAKLLAEDALYFFPAIELPYRH